MDVKSRALNSKKISLNLFCPFLGRESPKSEDLQGLLILGWKICLLISGGHTFKRFKSFWRFYLCQNHLFFKISLQIMSGSEKSAHKKKKKDKKEKPSVKIKEERSQTSQKKGNGGQSSATGSGGGTGEFFQFLPKEQQEVVKEMKLQAFLIPQVFPRSYPDQDFLPNDFGKWFSRFFASRTRVLASRTRVTASRIQF